jgi:hypothetical protein
VKETRELFDKSVSRRTFLTKTGDSAYEGKPSETPMIGLSQKAWPRGEGLSSPVVG